MNPIRPKPSPRAKPGRSHCRALTRTDLLFTVAAIAALAALLVTPLATIRRKARLSLCLANLQQITRAVLLYSEHNRKVLPGVFSGQSGDLWWWYKEQVKGYAGLSGPSSTNDRVFACPDDRGYSHPGPFWRNGRFDYGSYVYNGVTLPGAPNLSGWPLESVKFPRRTLLVMEWTAHAPLSWHKSRTGRENAPFYCDAQSVVGYVDGHVSFTKIYYDGYNAAYTRNPIAGYDYKYSRD